MHAPQAPTQVADPVARREPQLAARVPGNDHLLAVTPDDVLDAFEAARAIHDRAQQARLEHVDHRCARVRTQRDLRAAGLAQIGRQADVEAPREVRDERDRALDERVRVVGDDDDRVLGEEAIDAATGLEQPPDLAVGLGQRVELALGP